MIKKFFMILGMIKKFLMILGIGIIIVFSFFLIFFSKNLNSGLLGIIILGILGGVFVFGIVNVPPRHVLVVRNKFTGELIPKPPGLQWIFPGRDEVFKIHDCRPIVEPPVGIDAITKDAQKVTLMVQRSYWIDALEPTEEKFKEFKAEEKGEKKKEVKGKGEKRAILAATKITGVKKEEVVEEIKSLVENISESHLKRFVSQATIDNLEKDQIPEGFTVICPHCGTMLKASQEGSFPKFCPGKDCPAKWSKKEKKKEEKKEEEEEEREEEAAIPQTLLALISWGTSIWSDYNLAEGFGIGCEIRVLSLMPPKGLAETRLAQQVAEAQQEVAKAKQKVKEIEGQTLREFHKNTQISPQIVYLVDQAVSLGKEIVDLFKKEKKKEEKEGGEK